MFYYTFRPHLADAFTPKWLKSWCLRVFGITTSTTYGNLRRNLHKCPDRMPEVMSDVCKTHVIKSCKIKESVLKIWSVSLYQCFSIRSVGYILSLYPLSQWASKAATKPHLHECWLNKWYRLFWREQQLNIVKWDSGMFIHLWEVRCLPLSFHLCLFLCKLCVGTVEYWNTGVDENTFKSWTKHVTLDTQR